VDDNQLPWPESFEQRLNSKRKTIVPRTRAQCRAPSAAETAPKSIRVSGDGIDQNDLFFASGWLNPLEEQQGIPGWQRITLMKHFDESHNDDLWAYEGVVLPGGRIIVGRWWFASEDPGTPSYVSDLLCQVNDMTDEF